DQKMLRIRYEYPLLRPGVSESRIHQSDSGINGPAPCAWHSERGNLDQVCRVRGRIARRRLREFARSAVKGRRGGQTDVSPHQREFAEADETDGLFGKQLARPGRGRESAGEGVESKSHCGSSARRVRERAAAARFATA